jgi:Na+-driven multidrug efflux pump
MIRNSCIFLFCFVWATPILGFVLHQNVVKTKMYPSTLPSKTLFPFSSQSSNLLASEQGDESTAKESDESSKSQHVQTSVADSEEGASKRKMLGFAIPALGIYLANPLLSNIDNAFVGKTMGTTGLAAMSPATICTDQMLYLFSFLARATTGLVSSAYGSKTEENEKKKAASEAGSAPLTVSLISGFLLTIFYALFTPKMLSALDVTPALRGSAASYIYWRGAIAWAALAQSVCLSVIMATRDAVTPLKIVGIAAIVNLVGDYLLCVWPLRLGCSGAAAATAFATLFSSGFMVKALKKKGILPRVRMPTRKQIAGLMEFTGPLLAITITRLIGFVLMQRKAMTLGVNHTAAYQMSINLVIFYLLFAEPLSQLSQTRLPALIEAQDGKAVSANLRSVLSLGALTALTVGGIAGLSVFYGSSLFSSDLAVQALSKEASFSLFVTVVTAIFAGKLKLPSENLPSSVSDSFVCSVYVH